MNRVHSVLLISLLLTAAGCVSHRAPLLAPSAEALKATETLASDRRIVGAFESVDRDRERTLSEWRLLTEINAPSGHEELRARRVEALLREMGLESRRDAAGNLIATRKGRGEGPLVVIDAHLDTVFQPEMKIETTLENGRLHGPGVGDNTRNIAAILAMIRALDAAGIQTRGDLVFLFTVEEETNFRGINQFLADNKGTIDYFIALDGGYQGFTYGGIGINWYRHHFIGAGGHTLSANPPYSATLPMARAIKRIYELTLPRVQSTHINIGMLGGSSVVNAKAEDAWFTLDLRSTSQETIASLEKKIAKILDQEARRERMVVRTEIVSSSPAAQIPGHRSSPLVRTAEAVHLVLGFTDPPITPTASNHASPALRAGVAAISTGAAPCGDAHALSEWCEVEPIYRGIKKILLLGVALAGIDASQP